MRATPLTAFTDALEDLRAARSRNNVENISQWIVSKKESGLTGLSDKCYKNPEMMLVGVFDVIPTCFQKVLEADEVKDANHLILLWDTVHESGRGRLMLKGRKCPMTWAYITDDAPQSVSHVCSKPFILAVLHFGNYIYLLSGERDEKIDRPITHVALSYLPIKIKPRTANVSLA